MLHCSVHAFVVPHLCAHKNVIPAWVKSFPYLYGYMGVLLYEITVRSE